MAKHHHPAIKMRSNASTKARGSPLRAKHAREDLQMGGYNPEKKYDYGKRWAVEGAFSVVKRIMGESVYASNTENMLHEVGLKFKFANVLINAH